MHGFIVGLIAVVGALGFAARAVASAGLGLDSLVAVGLICGLAGLAGGAAVSRHMPVRSWVTPVAAAGAIFIAGAFIEALWKKQVFPHVDPVMLAVAAVAAGAGAYAGTRAVVRIAGRTPTWFALLVLSGLLTQGLIMTIWLPLIVADAAMGGTMVLLFACAVGGGFWTQMISPVRRVWACGSGAMLMVLLIVDLDPPLGLLVILTLSFAVYALLGSLGARLAIKVRPKPLALVEVPPAHTEVDNLGR